MKEIKNKFTEHIMKKVIGPIKKAKHAKPESIECLDYDPIEEGSESYEGDIEGEIKRFDDTSIKFEETIEIEIDKMTGDPKLKKKRYLYNLHNEENEFIFGYHNHGEDKIPHHTHLKTSPHHKHDGDEVKEGDKKIDLKNF
ncbi:toxin-antitoxin system TumE family protein [Halanaerobacter jeridensis]|uniref:Uncharacterized protein n=1 Tax=Halanaerobacter jeridensis TaxID=706427 RepID=A0A939BQH1_9FIRM|nr:DUF6516 family protein [Halanaerobacter jeridensis]MBM7558158.1 hypothetical protein [Halanaerobacter jeridensis]